MRHITINGFKSIRRMEKLELSNLNVIIGANGAGKSNFIQVFKLFSSMIYGGFSQFILSRGGADGFLYNGPKETSKIQIEVELEPQKGSSVSYHVDLIPTVTDSFLLVERRKTAGGQWMSYGTTSVESRIPGFKDKDEAGRKVYEALSNIVVYHFHDTSMNASLRRPAIIEDNKRLRGDASNIAPFLLHLKKDYSRAYGEILDAVRIVMPFFDDFTLDVLPRGEAEKVGLSWKQKGSDFPMQAYHLSDGSIRFICLATALLQPNPPQTIIIDEPELGLHPAAIPVLAEMIQAASQTTQVIVATQSPLLIDHFDIADILVMDRRDASTCVHRLDPKDFSVWLEDYSVGELWTKNVIERGPAK